MTRNTIYDRLREIGCSVETADATAEALEGMSDIKVWALILFMHGRNYTEISNELGFTRQYWHKVLNDILHERLTKT